MGLWSAEHIKTLLPSIILMVVSAAALRYFLRGKSEKWRMLPMKVIGVLLLLLEIGKQVISLLRGYDLYHLPFHFCSLFIFLIPMMAFYKGRHSQTVRGITAAISASLFVMMLIYPSLVYASGSIKAFFRDYMAFHTVAFHNLVMLAFLLIPALELHTPGGKKETGAVLCFVGGFCVVSASMAYILKTNFAGFYTCNIPFFETVRLAIVDAAGYVAAQLVYVGILVALNFAFVYGSHWAYRGISRLLNRKHITA